jgi:hypothetical protein
MSSIFFDGNTYTFGATVSANPGTGTTSYVFGDLSFGSTFGFILRAFNSFGFSNFVGPTVSKTLQQILETRDAINAFAWSYQYYTTGGNQTTSGGTTGNLFTSSGDLSSTTIWTFWSAAGYSRTTGFTAPNIPTNTDGLTSAWRLVSPNDTSSKQLSQTRYLEYGNTYIFSIYIDLTNSPSASAMRRPSAWTQTGPTYGVGTNITIPAGATGWTRFEFTQYVTSTLRRQTVPLVSFPGGGPFTVVIWGPMLEKK